MNSWQDLLTNYDPQAPANRNMNPFWNRFNNGESMRPPSIRPATTLQNPLDLLEQPNVQQGMNTNRNPWPFQRYGGPSASPQYEMPRLNPNVVSAAAQIAMKMLPLPVQAALTAGSAIMAPTQTAPPSMDEWPYGPGQ